MIMRMFGVVTPTNMDFVFKGASGVEVMLPSEVGKHMPYNPKLLPCPIGQTVIDPWCGGVFTYSSDDRRPNPLTTYWTDGSVDYMEEWN